MKKQALLVFISAIILGVLSSCVVNRSLNSPTSIDPISTITPSAMPQDIVITQLTDTSPLEVSLLT